MSARDVNSPFEPRSHYDLVLAVIPLALVASLLVGAVFPVPSQLAVLAGSAVGALAVADALFIHPPRDDGE